MLKIQKVYPKAGNGQHGFDTDGDGVSPSDGRQRGVLICIQNYPSISSLELRAV